MKTAVSRAGSTSRTEIETLKYLRGLLMHLPIHAATASFSMLVTSIALNAEIHGRTIASLEWSSQDECVVGYFNCHSETMNRDIRAWIVLPPAYQQGDSREFPILYALHGHGAPFDTYAKMQRLRVALGERPMIVAGFDGDVGSFYVDGTRTPHSRFTTFFFDEFIPAVEAHWKSNGQRAVTGFSMGGFGAMHYALCRPKLFTSVSGFSSAIGPFASIPERRRESYLELFSDEELASEENPFHIVTRFDKQIQSGNGFPPVYQHCGTEDFLLQSNRKFRDTMTELNAAILKQVSAEIPDGSGDNRELRDRRRELFAKRGIDFRYVESPGAHDWPFWHGHIVELLDFHERHFKADLRN